MEAKELADKIAALMDDRKAKQIEVINVADMTITTEYLVICSGTSTTHVKGIADEIEFRLKELGRPCSHIEGADTARWILLDYLDVVVHVFLQEEREFYNLERLWQAGGHERNL